MVTLPPGARRTDTDAVLDAVRDCVLAVGVRRTTLSDVARRAGVSRMTLYRSWPDVRTLVGDLMTREWQAVADMCTAAVGTDTDPGSKPRTIRDRTVASLVAVTRTMRNHPLFRKIIDVDPELLLTYLLDRRGASQDYFLETVTKLVASGQQDGSIRAGDPVLFTRAMLLVGQSFGLSARTMATGDIDVDALDAELARMFDRYLAP